MQRWTHYLLQRGDNVRARRAEHAPVTVDLTTVIGTGQGRRRRFDARVGRDTAPIQNVVGSGVPAQTENVLKLSRLLAIQNKYLPWRHHQSKVYVKPGKCGWERCPNLTRNV